MPRTNTPSPSARHPSAPVMPISSTVAMCFPLGDADHNENGDTALLSVTRIYCGRRAGEDFSKILVVACRGGVADFDSRERRIAPHPNEGQHIIRDIECKCSHELLAVLEGHSKH